MMMTNPLPHGSSSPEKLPNEVIEFIERTTLLATNHGGWFDEDGFKYISPLCDAGNDLLKKYCPQEESPDE
jgi:hypothetical protein